MAAHSIPARRTLHKISALQLKSTTTGPRFEEQAMDSILPTTLTYSTFDGAFLKCFLKYLFLERVPQKIERREVLIATLTPS